MRRRTALAFLTALLFGCGGPQPGNGSLPEVVVEPAPVMRVAESVGASARLEPTGEALLFGSGRISAVPVEPGDTVTAGEVMVSLSGDPAVFAAEDAAAERVEARQIGLGNARRDLERARELHASGAVSESSLEAAGTALDAAEAALEAARAELAGASASAAASTVSAPFDGVVGRVWARPGEMAGSRPLVQLTGTDGLRARLLLPRRYAGAVRRGAAAHFVPAGGAGPELFGTVVSVGGGLDPQTGLLAVEVSFRADGAARGAMGTVKVETDVAENVVAVPSDALRRTADCCRVAVVSGGVMELREVETGLSGGGRVEIAGGLSPGDSVIVESTGSHSEGDSVSVAGIRRD